MGDLRRWAGVLVVASMAIATACGSDEDAQALPAEPAADPSSVTSLVGSLSADQALVGNYFSFERYGAGSGVDLGGPTSDVLTEVFVDRSADGAPGEPFGSALKLMQLDDLMIDPGSVTATYDQAGSNGITLL